MLAIHAQSVGRILNTALSKLPRGTFFVLAWLAAVIQLIGAGGSSIYLDDSLISMHVVENALAGRGFVFNPGESLMVYSNPGFILLLYSVCKLGLSIPAGAYLIFFTTSAALAGFSGLMLRRIAPMAIGPVVCWILFHSESLWHSLKGMETSLFLACCTGAFALSRWNFSRLAAFLAAYAALCRPDAFIIPIIYIADRIQMERANGRSWREIPRQLVQEAAIILIVAGLWSIVALIMYGTVLPLTVEAKRLLVNQSSNRLWRSILRAYYPQYKLFFIADAVALAALCLFRRSRLLFSLGFGFFNLGILVLGSAPYFHWYVVPAAFSLLLTLAVASYLIGKTLLKETWVPLFTAMSVLLLFGWEAWHSSTAMFANLKPHVDVGKAAAASYIAQNRLPGEIAASDEVGFLGYYGGGYVLDTLGLLQRKTHPQIALNDRFGLLGEYRPDWVFGSFTVPDGQTLITNYEMKFPHPNYPVFKRRVFLPGDILARSNEFRIAIEQTKAIAVVDWPFIALDFPDFQQELLKTYPGANVVRLQRGALESLFLAGSTDRLVFAFDPRTATLIPAPSLQQCIDILRGSQPQGIATSWDQGPFPAVAGLAPIDSANPRLLRQTSSTPQIYYSGPYHPHPKWIIITYRLKGETSSPVLRTAAIYYSTDKRPGLSDTRAGSVLVWDDGQPHALIFDMTEADLALSSDESLQQVRFDPIVGYMGSTVEIIRWVMLAPP